MMNNYKNQRTKIWTDGGTPKNSRPFGNGYGSFRIGENGEINSIEFGIPMSNNAAEILTMVYSLRACQDYKVIIFSDSKIAVGWVKKINKLGVSIHGFDFPETMSIEMIDYIKLLSFEISQKNVKAEWRPREQIFKIFGH